jgi:hypothetical protein
VNWSSPEFNPVNWNEINKQSNRSNASNDRRDQSTPLGGNTT